MISEAPAAWLREDGFRRETEAESRREPLTLEQFEENLLAHGIIDWRQAE